MGFPLNSMYFHPTADNVHAANFGQYFSSLQGSEGSKYRISIFRGLHSG